ncbi:hypothetical protein [Phytopseudomonas punonensis]|uniref:hypothetical protein n=1 Tax=Phytopseudomonas punonensis TaxID=1220495 RepID=UPI000933A4C6|nr:hypothetical protein [Pseudomonas punonensis]
MKIDPIWINSSLLFGTGALLVVIGVLVLLLIEGRKTRVKLAAVLDASVARQNALRQEHCSEIEEIEQQHLDRMAAVATDHRFEIENLRVMLSIADQERDAALARCDDIAATAVIRID